MGAITRLTTLISLIRMFSDGPAVSLKGSPTVSPTTAALWASEPLPPWCAALDVLLGVVPGAAGVGHEEGHQHAARRSRRPARRPASPVPPMKPTTTGVSTPSRPGTIISLMAAAVEMSTQRA